MEIICSYVKKKLKQKIHTICHFDVVISIYFTFLVFSSEYCTDSNN